MVSRRGVESMRKMILSSQLFSALLLTSVAVSSERPPKIEGFRFPVVSLPSCVTNIEETIQWLADYSKIADPEGQGIVFRLVILRDTLRPIGRAASTNEVVIRPFEEAKDNHLAQSPQGGTTFTNVSFACFLTNVLGMSEWDFTIETHYRDVDIFLRERKD
jgi:hypothetical protein